MSNTKYSSTGKYLHKEFEYIESSKGWWFIGKRKIITNMVSRYCKSSKRQRILDVGCGTGFILEQLTSIGIPYGIDINKTAVAICRKRGLKNVKVGNIQQIPFKNSYFDIVIMADIIEHIVDDQQAIREAYRILKKNGILIIHTPSISIPWSKLDDEFGHVRRYDIKRLQKIILNTKFKLLKLTYTNFFLYLPILLIRLLQQKKENALKLDSTGMTLLPRPVETIFSLLFSSEAFLLRYINLPIGVSLLTMAQK